MTSHDIKSLTPATQRPQDLNGAFNRKEFDKAWQGLINQIKALIEEVKAGKVVSGTILMILMQKLSTLSQQLQEGPAAADNELSNVLDDLNNLENIILQMQKEGNEWAKNGHQEWQNKDHISIDQVKKFKAALDKFTKDSAQLYFDWKGAGKHEKGYFGIDDLPNRSLNEALRIFGTGNSIGTMTTKQLQTFLTHLSFISGWDTKNNDDTDPSDDFRLWLQGGNDATPNNGGGWVIQGEGLDALKSSLSSGEQETNDIVNEKGQLINTIYDVLKDGVSEYQKGVDTMIRNQGYSS